MITYTQTGNGYMEWSVKWTFQQKLQTMFFKY